jgi:hypothetical protein
LLNDEIFVSLLEIFRDGVIGAVAFGRELRAPHIWGGPVEFVEGAA